MDKNKIIEAATKFVQKGQYDKAIKEYQKLLEAEPKDSRTLQKVGELYQKKGENDQAAEYFLKVGESYSADGFFLKAVAVFKQVIKLDEKRIDVNLKLAELYQQLGLMSDAMAQLQLVSTHYERSGDTAATLDLLRRMVDLDPDNVASRIKLAELFARDNLNQEAVTEFQRAAEYLKRNNRIDDYLKVAERLIFIDPSNLELARELAQIYLAKEDTKRALAKLQVCFKADPRDVETLNLLAQAFLNLGQISKTISVYKELAKIFDEQDRIDDERAIWEKIRSIAPDDPDVLNRVAPQAAAASPASSAPEPPRGHDRPAHKGNAEPAAAAGPDQVAKLLTETDVYVKYGLHEKALEHLRKVFAADPSNLDGHDRAYQIAKAMGQHARAEEELVTVIKLASTAGDIPRAQARLQELLETNPGHPEVGGFLESIGTPAPMEDVAEVVDESLVIDSADDASIVEEAPAEEIEVLQSADDEVIVSSEAAEDLIVEDEPLMAEAESLETVDDEALVVASSEEPFAEADESLIASVEPELEDPTSPGMMLPRADEILVSSHETSAEEVIQGDQADEEIFSSVSDDAIEEIPPEDVTRETQLGLGTQSRENEGTQEGATRVVSLDELIKASEVARSARAEAAARDAAERAADESVEAEASVPFEAEEPPAEDPASDELDEAAFFISQGDLEEARDILETVMLAYPGNARAASLISELEQKEQESAAPEHVEGDSAFDLAAELAEELGGQGESEATPLSPGDDGFQISAEDVFAEFKKGVSKVVKPEDVDTHYDLGIAYKEMGLFPDAIGEFEQALAGATGKPREIDCYVMVSACKQAQQDYVGAIETLRRGLALPQVTPDSAKSMQYDVGASHEALSQKGLALAYYRRVAAVDPRFRDVQGAITRIEADGVEEEDPDEPSNGGSSDPGGGGGKPPGASNKNGVNGSHTSPRSGSPAGPKDAPKSSRKIGYV